MKYLFSLLCLVSIPCFGQQLQYATRNHWEFSGSFSFASQSVTPAVPRLSTSGRVTGVSTGFSKVQTTSLQSSPSISYFVFGDGVLGLSVGVTGSGEFAQGLFAGLYADGNIRFVIKASPVVYPYIEGFYGQNWQVFYGTSNTSANAAFPFYGGRAGLRLAVAQNALVNVGAQYSLGGTEGFSSLVGFSFYF
jgi:hypothetical protein